MLKLLVKFEPPECRGVAKPYYNQTHNILLKE